MFDMEDVEQAIQCSENAHQLLLWMGSLIDDSKLSLADARCVLSTSDAVHGYLLANAASLPATLRPMEEAINGTANILGTYLAVSFDLQEKPKR
jgi:hypothetical protein